jgi:Icc-related predicted phosphoesterase
MKLGVVSDIHGNRVALEAVIADAASVGVDRWWVLGDLVDDPRAAYAVVHADRHGHHVEHRRVDYYRDAFLRRVLESGHPQHDYIASFQRGEQVRYPSRRPGAPSLPE